MMLALTFNARMQIKANSTPSGRVRIATSAESFEDAAVVGAQGRTSFEVDAELVESLGADKYVHFRAATAQADQLAELAEESGPSENLFVARISADSTATTGSKVRLVIDPAKLALFDAATGVNVSIPPVV